MPRQRLRLLRPQKLRVLREPDVHEGLYRGRSVGRDEGCELYRVAVDLADVEVGADGGDEGGGDVVGGAPDAFGGGVLEGVSWKEEGEGGEKVRGR